jgi:hypothetical protein
MNRWLTNNALIAGEEKIRMKPRSMLIFATLIISFPMILGSRPLAAAQSSKETQSDKETIRDMQRLEENLQVGMRLSTVPSDQRIHYWDLISKTTSPSGTVETYNWKTPSGRNLYLLFYNGVLVSFTEISD